MPYIVEVLVGREWEQALAFKLGEKPQRIVGETYNEAEAKRLAEADGRDSRVRFVPTP